MNSRLRELAERASRQAPDGYPVIIPYNDDFVERYTQLVIEYALRAARTGIEFGPSMDAAVYTYFGIDHVSKMD